jgi:hypothetical protein
LSGVRAAGCTRDSPTSSFLFAEIPLRTLREKKYTAIHGFQIH